MSDNQSSNDITIYVDDIPYQISSKDNLLAGVLSKKLNLPYFCWHPSMGSVGACRQCAVTQYQDENDTRGRLVMACTTPVSEGMRISIKNPYASEFREQVIAAMMTNHPHDCPVCAEGGECHLQDMTVMTGHSMREYSGSKRTFKNQYLGELVGHEMNRCITCYRCTRFYNDYAGGKDFGVYGSKNQVYFGRQKDGALESEFSGNLVEVCPTGVFTNKLFSAHFSRKWDLQSAPSVCAHCSVGCNTSIGERYGSVRRVMNRYNHDINGYFLCDRGRFGIGFVNGEQRIRSQKGFSQQSPVKLTSLDVAKTLVHFRGKKFVGIGSPRASLEANFYLQQLVGDDHFSPGFSDEQMALSALHQSLMHQYPAPNLSDIEKHDFVLIIGEDITQTAPRVALSIRQALRNASIEKASKIGIPPWQDSAVRTIGGKTLSPLFSMHSIATKLDDVAKAAMVMSPKEIEHCLIAMTHQLNQHLDTPSDKKVDVSEPQQDFINQLLASLSTAKKPLIVSGWSLQSSSLLNAINKLMAVLHSDQYKHKNQASEPTNLAIFAPSANSVGLISLLSETSLSVEQVIELSQSSNDLDGLILLEQELTQCNEQQIKQLRERVNTIIVLEHSESRLTGIADIVMPVSPVSESDGHYVNYQGRVQRFYQVHSPILPIQDSWRWLDLMAKSIFKQADISKQSFSDFIQFLSAQYKQWPLSESFLSSSDKQQSRGVARQTHRTSGRTSQMANISVHEAKATQTASNVKCENLIEKNNEKSNEKNNDVEIYNPNEETSFNFSMEGSGVSSTPDMPFTWAPGWNSNQSISQFQSQVAGNLINDYENAQVTFNTNQAFIEQCLSNVRQREVSLTFIQELPWYKGDWQSNFNPEFTLLNKGNLIAVSQQLIDEQCWQVGQYLKMNIGEVETLALLQSNEQLPSDMVTGMIYEIAIEQTNTEIHLSLASEDEIAAHQQQQKSLHDAALIAKSNTLERLKVQDQSIPIRLVSGGLDDA